MKFGEIDIQIIRSKRKTVSIFVERDGTVAARVPEGVSDEVLQEVFKAKEYQIYKNLAEWKQLNANKVDRVFMTGQSFLYLGRNYRFKLVDEVFKGVKLKNGSFILSREYEPKAKSHFMDFYKEKLNEKLQPIVKRYREQLGVEPGSVRVMELQHRWASCSEKGNLHFHWKCAMAPIDVLNYIVAHEMVHLIHPNHTTAFWNDVDKISPNYEKHVLWLKENGSGMDL